MRSAEFSGGKESSLYAGGGGSPGVAMAVLWWIPLWATIAFLFALGWFFSRPCLVWTTLPGFSARQICFAFKAFQEFWFKLNVRVQPEAEVEKVIQDKDGDMPPPVTTEDLKDLFQRIECENGGPVWQLMMEKSIPGMTYQAWRRDPQTGPTEYRSRTLFEDVTPEIVRDFFWDDEFREVWDGMLISKTTLKEYQDTGASVAHWIRKFPFFCSDREYIIGRRIWVAGRSYFCITKGLQWALLPQKKKPRRVDLYYSSWFIRETEVRKSGVLKTASEVLLFHHEDMGIPKELAKLGIRQGMWGHVRNIERGLRKYQASRKASPQLSRSAMLAQINTQVPPQIFEVPGVGLSQSKENHEQAKGGCPWKWVIVGGAVVLALTIDRGVIGKGLVFGITKRLGRLGR